MTNVAPPDELPPNLHTEFRGRYRDCVEPRLERFREREEDYKENLEENIKKDKRHRELLNLCIFPFSESQPLGFKIIRTDPLTELDEPNFDFMLFDFGGNAIFGEVKASIGDGYEGGVVRDVVEQRKRVEENLEYIEENYTGLELSHSEYVIAVYAPDADDVTREILSQEEDIVTWKLHQYDKKLNVNTAVPEPYDWPDDPEEVSYRITHNLRKLNSIMPLSSSTECYDYFLNSHAVAKLRAIIRARTEEAGHCYLSRRSLRGVVKDDLMNVSNETIKTQINFIIREGENIGFLREHEGDEGDYKIVSRYTSSDGLEDTLSRKWVEHQAAQEKDKRRNNCWHEVKDEMMAEFEKQKTMEEFL